MQKEDAVSAAANGVRLTFRAIWAGPALQWKAQETVNTVSRSGLLGALGRKISHPRRSARLVQRMILRISRIPAANLPGIRGI